ncbi:MAG: efflux RND transporter permease subunit [Pseudomonadales bacterium]|nr:efflux RND transporter permease subunit [Pseudomonadales bacterium]MBO6564238.1 efflux RND transporter permease subunit [Pseudomonadales bacterium]MBO6597063.1 efflux RND transporter permease subunit [Pseudomonadales bacterium]MBO6823750.1 efflux RND transporter permease subunit [Pseudomonadales bacterium]
MSGDIKSGVDDLPSLSIRRPVLVLVVNLLIALAGIAAIMAIEVRELPDVDRPVVSVRAVYPGASPETMDAEVISRIEGAVARVSGIKRIESSSEETTGRIRIEFRPGTDLNSAAADVREAVSRISRRLPERVEQVVVVKADDDSRAIVNLAVVSDRLMEDELTHIVETDIIPSFLSIDGVADVQTSGARQRLLRVVVDPLRLTSYGLSVTDVARVLRQAAFDVPAGSFRSQEQELLVRADATVVSAEQVKNIIISDTRRIGDVANVYFGPEDASSYTRLNGRNVIGLGIIRQAQSNTIRISGGVHKAVEQLNRRFDDLEIVTTDDSASFIRSSVREVLKTLMITIGIVIGTIYLFIGSIRATVIPSIAIPVALIGTVAGIWMLGFSINILTLLALVLATGLVVDDAIVVLENIQRRRVQGVGPRAAAVLGTRQVFFAVVTTSIVLISVFVPIAFLPSTSGRLFREFGFVLALAVGISSFVALSLVPAAAARLPDAGEPGRFRLLTLSLGARIRGLYEKGLILVLSRPAMAVLVAAVLGVGAASLYPSLDKELLPPEDRSMIRVFASGPDGVGVNYMERQTLLIEDILQPWVDRGIVKSTYALVGNWDPNLVFISVPLLDWKERDVSQGEMIRAVKRDLDQLPGVRGAVFADNSLNLRRGGGGGIEVALVGNDYDEIYQAARGFVDAIEESEGSLSNPRISYEPTQPQLSVEIDRRRAADLGIDLDELAGTLRAMIDGDEIIDLNVGDEAIPIVLESAAGDINDPMDLVNLHVAAKNGRMLPLSSLVTLKEEGVATELDRQAQRRAIEVDINVTPGYPLKSAVDELVSIANESLPEDIDVVLEGEAAELEESSREVVATYLIAILVVFLVLCAQFEGFTSAIVITMIIPLGVAAAVFALFLSGTSVNIYSQIGLVMLIGLMAKNGILLVEFADQLRDRGYPLREAIIEGSKVRFRPVAMTLMSTVLGGLPLILGSGAGIEARESIGWVIFGGLGIAAIFTLFLTPALYLLIARFSKPRIHEEQRMSRELAAAESLSP